MSYQDNDYRNTAQDELGMFTSRDLSMMGRLDPPVPIVRPVTADEHRTHYSLLYQTEDNDSTPECRAAMADIVVPHLYTMPEGSIALDLGAGRQIFEVEMIDRHGAPPGQLITVDIADIAPSQLLAGSSTMIEHIQASGSDLPLADMSVDLAYSILAFDFFDPRDDAVAELYRVLKPGARAYLALHDPKYVFPNDLDTQANKSNRRVQKPRNASKPEVVLAYQALTQKRRMRDSRTLFEDPNAIREFFRSRGFKVDEAFLAGTEFPRNTWWQTRIAKA